MKLTKFVVALIVMVFLGMVSTSAYAAMALQWDSYTDSSADGLRILSSTDNINFSTLVDNIPTDKVVSTVPNGPQNTRVYYKMIAFDGDVESTPTNTVSYYWDSQGGGSIGIQAPGTIRLIDCSDPANDAICQDAHIGN